MKTLAAIYLTALIFVSCTSNEIGYSHDVNPETIYMDYNIYYDEDEDSISCFLQYRFAGENGTTLVLSQPSFVSIDNDVLGVDSSDFSGAYYQKNYFAKTFKGTHVIAFTDVNGKTKNESFYFNPIKLSNKNLTPCKQNDLVFNFTGIEESNVVEINISDTSSQTEDLVVKAKPVNGKLIIKSNELEKLAIGPCTIEVYENSTKPLQQSTAEGGKITIVHLIKEIKTSLAEKDKKETAIL